jgi:hypothetical protein
LQYIIFFYQKTRRDRINKRKNTPEGIGDTPIDDGIRVNEGDGYVLCFIRVKNA